MKNRKGFTLVELLATIVILGVIMVFGIPLLINLLNNSRNKIYVEDAKKLVSKVEYKMKSNSSYIEKPDPGNCIIISLLYLDDGEFDNPPNDGEYLKENSYVVVKNAGTKMQYAVTLIEKTKKKGYIGIELSTYESLIPNSATKKIRSFKANKLKKVGSTVSTEKITKSYINGKISGFVTGSISASYNSLDLTN